MGPWMRDDNNLSAYLQKVLHEAFPYRVGNTSLSDDNEITTRDVLDANALSNGADPESDPDEWTAVQMTAADFNRTGEISVRDVLDINRIITGVDFQEEPDPSVTFDSDDYERVDDTEFEATFSVENNGNYPTIDAIFMTVEKYRDLTYDDPWVLYDNNVVFYDLAANEDERQITAPFESGIAFDSSHIYRFTWEAAKAGDGSKTLIDL